LQQAGPFVITLATRNAEAAAALQATREVLNTYIEDGPTHAELQQAKANIIGGFPLRYDNNGKLLPYLADHRAVPLAIKLSAGLSPRCCRRDVAQIRDAWRRRIVMQQMQIVTVGATP
jgi:zinc protease